MTLILCNIIININAELIRAISSQESLLPALTKIDKRYKPEQIIEDRYPRLRSPARDGAVDSEILVAYLR